MKKVTAMLTVLATLSSPAFASSPAYGQQDESKMDMGHDGHKSVDPHAAHKMPRQPVSDPSADFPPTAHSNSEAPNAADAIWGAEAMKPSRDALYKEHGNMRIFWFQGDRNEIRARSGKRGYLWDVQGYYGGDRDKFWFKSEGEGSFSDKAEQAEIQALYSRAIAPFFDLQVGVRQDLTGPRRTHLAIGAQGLMPYILEIDATAFVSQKGDMTARMEVEYDHRLTQKLILQPRAEINLSAQDILELRVGSGIDSIEAGLRLRYETTPEFAPYLGIEQEWKLGGSRNFAIADGKDPSVTNYVIGIRFWF